MDHHPKETFKLQARSSASRISNDNEQPVRTNLRHQISIKDHDDILQDQGHDQDEQATKVNKQQRQFMVHNLKDLFENKLGAKHFDYEQTTASIVK